MIIAIYLHAQVQAAKMNTLVNKFMFLSRVSGILYIIGITLERSYVLHTQQVQQLLQFTCEIFNLLCTSFRICFLINISGQIRNILSRIPDVHQIYCVS